MIFWGSCSSLTTFHSQKSTWNGISLDLVIRFWKYLLQSKLSFLRIVSKCEINSYMIVIVNLGSFKIN